MFTCREWAQGDWIRAFLMNIGAKILWGDLSEGAKEGNFRLDLAGEENFDMSGAKNFRRVARGG